MKPQPSHLQALVFDFDGTLAALNIDFIKMRHAVLEHLRAYGVQTSDLENLFVLEIIKAGQWCVSQRHPAAASRYAQEALQLIQEIELQAAREGRLIGGTREMLSELRQKHIKIGIVTRNCRDALEQVFPDIYTFVDVVLTRNHIDRVKPDPEHLRQALFKLRAEPVHSAMMGDHPMDIKLGLDVGTWTIGVLTGYADKDTLMDAGAELVIKTAADIVHFLS